MNRDYALTADPNGRVVVHAAGCPAARAAADRGEMVMTLLQCENPLPPDLLRHDCLQGEK